MMTLFPCCLQYTHPYQLPLNISLWGTTVTIVRAVSILYQPKFSLFCVALMPEDQTNSVDKMK